MEIKKFYNEYLKYSTREFYDWMSQGKVMEVRFLSDYLGNKFRDYELIKRLGEKLDVETRFTSLYINTYEQLKRILLFRKDGLCLTKLYNIFISVNPRRKAFIKTKKGLIRKSYYGGIAGTSCVQNILCDIEHIGDREGNATEAMLEECIEGAKYLIKLLELEDYYLNISGNGVHLWIRLETAIVLPMPDFTELADKLKYKLKEEPINKYIKQYNRYIEHLNSLLKSYNPLLKVDEGAKDLSRIARPAGSWNVKKNKKERAVGTVLMCKKLNKDFNSKYTSVQLNLNKEQKRLHNKFIITNNHRYNINNLRECPLYKLLISKFLPSTLSRNHYLEQSFALILRDNNIDISLIPDLIQEIDFVQQKNIQVDPGYLDENLIFNSEMVNHYCIESKIDLVYPLLEEYPDVKDDFIDAYKYRSWSSYSWKAVQAMAIKEVKKPKDYMELKSLLRDLVNIHPKQKIFLTLRLLYKDDWIYYHRNRIFLQLLNRTRVLVK